MAERRSSRLSRRRLLAAVGSTVPIGVAGCAGRSGSVTVLAAGSLAATFEDHVGPAFESETGVAVHGEYYGTNALLRMVEGGTKRPDVVVGADAPLLRERLYGDCTDWDVEFATNSLGIGYDATTPFGRGLADGKRWYDLARAAPGGTVAIGEPDLDPLGYRALLAFSLAGERHALRGFRADMRRLVSTEPDEPRLLADVETGARAAGVVYRNMALAHDLPFLEFPDAYNFADPAMADRYATVSYTTDDGYTAVGRPIVYNATVFEGADHPGSGYRLVRFLLENPRRLEAAGLTVGANVPRRLGAVPGAIVA